MQSITIATQIYEKLSVFETYPVLDQRKIKKKS